MIEQVCRSCDSNRIETLERRGPGPVWGLFSAPVADGVACSSCGVKGDSLNDIADEIEIDDAILSRDLG